MPVPLPRSRLQSVTKTGDLSDHNIIFNPRTPDPTETSCQPLITVSLDSQPTEVVTDKHINDNFVPPLRPTDLTCLTGPDRAETTTCIYDVTPLLEAYQTQPVSGTPQPMTDLEVSELPRCLDRPTSCQHAEDFAPAQPKATSTYKRPERVGLPVPVPTSKVLSYYPGDLGLYLQSPDVDRVDGCILPTQVNIQPVTGCSKSSDDKTVSNVFNFRKMSDNFRPGSEMAVNSDTRSPPASTIDLDEGPSVAFSSYDITRTMDTNNNNSDGVPPYVPFDDVVSNANILVEELMSLNNLSEDVFKPSAFNGYFNPRLCHSVQTTSERLPNISKENYSSQPIADASIDEKPAKQDCISQNKTSNFNDLCEAVPKFEMSTCPVTPSINVRPTLQATTGVTATNYLSHVHSKEEYHDISPPDLSVQEDIKRDEQMDCGPPVLVPACQDEDRVTFHTAVTSYQGAISGPLHPQDSKNYALRNGATSLGETPPLIQGTLVSQKPIHIATAIRDAARSPIHEPAQLGHVDPVQTELYCPGKDSQDTSIGRVLPSPDKADIKEESDSQSNVMDTVVSSSEPTEVYDMANESKTTVMFEDIQDASEANSSISDAWKIKDVTNVLTFLDNHLKDSLPPESPTVPDPDSDPDLADKAECWDEKTDEYTFDDVSPDKNNNESFPSLISEDTDTIVSRCDAIEGLQPLVGSSPRPDLCEVAKTVINKPVIANKRCNKTINDKQLENHAKELSQKYCQSEEVNCRESFMEGLLIGLKHPAKNSVPSKDCAQTINATDDTDNCQLPRPNFAACRTPSSEESFSETSEEDEQVMTITPGQARPSNQSSAVRWNIHASGGLKLTLRRVDETSSSKIPAVTGNDSAYKQTAATAPAAGNDDTGTKRKRKTLTDRRTGLTICMGSSKKKRRRLKFN